MANKQITDLDSVIEVDPADLLLVRKSGQAEDASINVSNFITSIGNPSVNGYYQDSYDFFGQIMGLKPSNNTDVVTVGQGMKVSFLATDDIDGQSYITFDGNLSYPLYQYNKDLNPIPIDVGAGDYIETIFNNDQFFQVNIPTTQIYTNDYLAEGVVAGDESSTTYTLASAIGVLAQSYYNGMSIIFTSDIESKGNVFVNVDGLGDQVLTDKAGDMIANNLEENQVIIAIYNGTDFIKNYFSESVPEVPELPADAIDDEGDIIIENVPDDNKVQVTVGNAGNDYTTIIAALADLDKNFGFDGGNRLATILLSDTYVWNEKISLSNKDYSWITIHSPNSTDVTTSPALQLASSSINITGLYECQIASRLFIQCYSSFINLENFTCNFSSTQLSSSFSLLKATNSKVTLDNCTLSSSSNPTASNINSGRDINYISLKNSTPGSFIKNTTINGYIEPNNTGAENAYIVIESGSITIDNMTLILNAISAYIGKAPKSGGLYCIHSNLIIRNSLFQLQGFDGRVLIPYGNASFSNTTIQNGDCDRLLQMRTQTGNLIDCNVRSSRTSAYVYSGGDVTISGGVYTKLDGLASDRNIYCTDRQSIIRLNNDPEGTTFATNFGQIVTE